MSAAPAGVLLLDKPLGLSSNAALQRVRALAGGLKAGHTGSLDPLATGMLPICLGEATKLAGEMLSQRKCYRFGVQLGERTDTGDAEGSVVERAPVPPLGRASVEAQLQKFCGQQQQVPPMYSALKRDGEPLYRLARRGESVERAARAITIERFELLQLQADRLELRVLCSKGTYVRVLAEDLARALGSCGRLYSLRRDYVEPFAEEAMHTLEQLQAAGELRHWPLLSADRALSHLPALQLTTTALAALVHGQPVQGVTTRAALWRLYDAGERFVGLGQSDSGATLRVQRLFSTALAPR
ncbi:MAG TPA: tRNA pseudouridine(55) synthase TruB [Steroidobacteraceae bacterium]